MALGQGAEVRPGDERPEIPEPPPEDRPPEPVLPPTPQPPPPPTERPPSSAGVRVFARSYQILGNTVLSSKEIQDIVRPYVGRWVTTEELEELRYKLTLKYIKKGYTTSGVIIPDQDVEDGIITLQVIEGVLSRINISGKNWLRDDYIRKRVELGTGPPLNLVLLKERLQLLNRSPLIEELNGQLKPGTKLGESELDLQVKDRRAYQTTFEINNYRAPSVGSIQGETRAEHRNLTGWGDAIRLRYKKTEGLDDWTATYSIPITARDTTLGIEYQSIDSKVVFPDKFEELDIETKFDQGIIRLSHPLITTLSRTVTGTIRLEKRTSKTYLLGERFSFSPGVNRGKSQVTPIRFVADWLEQAENQVIAARSTFSVGLDALGATSNNKQPDGQFFTWLGLFQ